MSTDDAPGLLYAINLLLGIVVAGIGWFANTIWTAHKDLTREFHDLSERLARDYLPSTQYQTDMREIRSRLDAIISMLSGKADRHDG